MLLSYSKIQFSAIFCAWVPSNVSSLISLYATVYILSVMLSMSVGVISTAILKKGTITGLTGFGYGFIGPIVSAPVSIKVAVTVGMLVTIFIGVFVLVPVGSGVFVHVLIGVSVAVFVAVLTGVSVIVLIGVFVIVIVAVVVNVGVIVAVKIVAV